MGSREHDLVPFGTWVEHADPDTLTQRLPTVVSASLTAGSPDTSGAPSWYTSQTGLSPVLSQQRSQRTRSGASSPLHGALNSQ